MCKFKIGLARHQTLKSNVLLYTFCCIIIRRNKHYVDFVPYLPFRHTNVHRCIIRAIRNSFIYNPPNCNHGYNLERYYTMTYCVAFVHAIWMWPTDDTWVVQSEWLYRTIYDVYSRYATTLTIRSWESICSCISFSDCANHVSPIGRIRIACKMPWKMASYNSALTMVL